MRLILAFLCLFPLVGPAAAAAPEQWRAEWPETDFSQTTVGGWAEIISGGPGRDGIPAITGPSFLRAEDAQLEPREPVMVLQIEGRPARAYPLRYLIWHEIVNDSIGGVPIAVTYCPLCNSAMVFDRRVDGRELEFGVTGKLRNSDMIMFDRQTESWWQQAVGEAIVGELTGTELESLPAWLDSWQGFRGAFPDGFVMAQPDYGRNYGQNPYQNYDRSGQPFLYNGENPPHGIPALARVVRVGDRAWPLNRLVAEDTIEEAGVVLSLAGAQASALDTRQIADGRSIASVRVRDDEGRDVPHDVMFAFAFHAFWPEGDWMLPAPVEDEGAEMTDENTEADEG
ncbi:DUF3179 domain-containing protein [Litorisediminicola beolgyonensis]|uniref:DUF3179 domain-containing protein n=1 Tax=Litorisediminicola beolgyonensis TaxID=1173614 RepID=A0ABW3ZMR3_9RHOB